jgi:hypothetical protein
MIKSKKNKVGRPKIMKNSVRTLVQLDAKDFKELKKILDVSVAQFFRDAVKEKLDETLDAKHQNKN